MCLVPAPGEFSASGNDFSKSEKMAPRRGMFLSLLLRRMKAFIDEFQPNTSQANYFEGFWRITSKIKKQENLGKKTV